jgi:hypothetical protein
MLIAELYHKTNFLIIVLLFLIIILKISYIKFYENYLFIN